MDFETIYKKYFSVVYGYILSISGDPLTAEEITQDTFFKALKKIDDFRGESTLKVWLCQIAKNTYFNYVKPLLFYCFGYCDFVEEDIAN